MIQKIIRDTEGNLITERPIGEIEIIRPPFRCVIKRYGQEDANLGNRIYVEFTSYILSDSTVCEFSTSLFGFEICSLKKNKIGLLFEGNKWKDAFEQAEKYFNEECDRYEHLLFEREQALKNAE